MKLDILIATPGTKLRLQLRPNADVLTYAVFVKKYTSTGAIDEAVWHADKLSSDGGNLLLENVRGYKLFLHAAVKSEGNAEMKADLEFDGKAVGSFPNPFPLPAAEGPVVEREWSILMI